MEKLLQLLNEYEKGKPFQFTGYDERYGIFETSLDAEGNTGLPEETIISKKFGFIQWLVENNHIRTYFFSDVIKEVLISDDEIYQETEYYNHIDSILMLLSIKNNPISFLIYIMK